jgi:hypothetical protein
MSLQHSLQRLVRHERSYGEDDWENSTAVQPPWSVLVYFPLVGIQDR